MPKPHSLENSSVEVFGLESQNATYGRPSGYNARTYQLSMHKSAVLSLKFAPSVC